MNKLPHIAVIGAGIAGLSCATQLQEAGLKVSVFDKSRGPGGRMSTRRGDDWQCDHGAQYFTARDADFQAEVARWQAAGVAALWQPRLAVLGESDPAAVDPKIDRFVGTPRMTAPARFLAEKLPLSLQATVQGLEKMGESWRLTTVEQGKLDSEFSAVLLAIPAPQAVPLLELPAPALATLAECGLMRGCWSLMLRYDKPLDLPFDAAFVKKGPLRWVARDSSKPGRAPEEGWLLHANAHWSEAHLEDVPGEEAWLMLAAFAELGAPLPKIWMAQRWRYANTEPAFDQMFAWEPQQGIGLCGDWLNSGRVEGAWTSGRALAQQVIASFGLR